MSTVSGLTSNGRTLILRSSAPLVGHTQWVAKAISAASTSGQGLALLTPNTTKITRSLAHLFGVLGIMWVVDDGRESLYEGTTGQRVSERNGDFFADDVLYAGYSRRGSAQDRGGVWVQAETLMPRRAQTQAGDLAEAVCQALTGAPPLGWGIQEPVTQPWSIADISERYSRDKAAGHFLHFVGLPPLDGRGQATGSLEIQKPRNGVVEHVEAAAELAAPWSLSERVDYARKMHEARVRWARVFHVVGSDPAVVPPRYLGVPVPSILVFGPEVIGDRNPHEFGELALMHGAAHYEVMGEPRAASLAVILRDEPHSDVPAPALAMETLYRALMPSWPTA